MSDLRLLEEDYEDTIVDAAKAFGYRVHVERKARTNKGWRTPVKGHAGFPDLVIVGHGRLIVAELKRKPNQLSAGQAEWLEALGAVDCPALDVQLVWVPEQMQNFIGYLAACAKHPKRWSPDG